MAKSKDMFVGSVYPTINHGDAVILEYRSYIDITIQFVNSGSITTCTAGNLRKGKVKDKYNAITRPVGVVGEGKYDTTTPFGKKAYSVWNSMLNRCYNSSNVNYHLYGGRGVTVDSVWHCFQHFAAWYEQHYFDDCHLDKDILVKGNLIYGPDTCHIVSPQENIEAAIAKSFMFTDPTGQLHEVYNLRQFCLEHNLNRAHMCNVAHRKRNQYKGWRKYEP